MEILEHNELAGFRAARHILPKFDKGVVTQFNQVSWQKIV
jgi:hypothetical protein